MGEWAESTRKSVRAWIQRRAVVISKRALVERTDGRDEDAGGWDADVYAAIEAQRREQESDEEDAEALRDGQTFLDWAVPQLSAKRRAVIELDRAEVPVEEIQERLDVSRDVVYASRSRALKDLAKLRDRYKP
jgi:DNA-directed RNA polymerase specialized sigma24 family protein